jgi:acyl carrier protein
MSEAETCATSSNPRPVYWDLVEKGIARLLLQKDLPPALLTPETVFVSLKLDSLDVAEMLVDFELSLEIEIGAEDMAGVTKLSDLAGLIQRLDTSANV